MRRRSVGDTHKIPPKEPMDMATALEARAMNEQRDASDNLICPHVGCNTVIRALTGLQELRKMRQHFARKHK